MSGIDDMEKCEHGTTREDRRRLGCNGCDADRAKERDAATAEEERRERVIETARTLLAPVFIDCRNADRDAPFSYAAGEAAARALIVAAEFESHAAEYRATGE